MLEKFTYTNNFNETLEFGNGSLFVNENDLRDFAWDITSNNNKISSFKKGIVSKTIPVILKCETEDEGIVLRNRLFEVFEKDVLAKKHGKIQIGDYYLRCFITGSKKTEYLINDNYMVVSLTVQTDLPEWIKETTTQFNLSVESNTAYLDFPYDFSFDFRRSTANQEIYNTALIGCDFILTVFGFVENPTVYIGGHRYAVKVVVDTNEYLTIDSANKTIVLTKSNGEKVNCFHYRHRDSYVFEKIPSGNSVVVSANNTNHFNITLFEERSEPKWN